MFHVVRVVLYSGLLFLQCSLANAIVIMDFESSYSPSSKKIVQGDFEINMGGPYGFMQKFAASSSMSYPQNGTSIIQTSTQFQYPAILTASNGSVFDMLSIDIGEYSSVYRVPMTSTFKGFTTSGQVLTQAFTVDGFFDGQGGPADYETFAFGADWRDLVKVEFGFALTFDNIRINENASAAVPEPGTSGLFLIGTLGLLRKYRQKVGTASIEKNPIG